MATNQGGFTPLHAAAYSGDIGIAELLLEHGADVNARSELLVSPLHAAAEENHADMVKLLIARGARLDATEAGGYTPLTRVSIKNRTDMIVLLKQNGAECQPENVTSKAVHSICVAAGR
jgi:ankyrin repeat protein